MFSAIDSSPYPHPNKHSWNKNASVLFIDNPSGVGFNRGYQGEKITDADSGEREMNFLLKWYEEYPQYLANELWITGESYAGVYVPWLAYNLLVNGHTTKDNGKINLKGVAIGNGVTDWRVDGDPAWIEMAWYHGLIPLKLK